jgi:hypothetical protein
MKCFRHKLLSPLFAVLLSCQAPLSRAVQQNTPSATPQPAPPTGTYTEGHSTNRHPAFILRLETNGTYVAESSIPRHSQGIDGGGNFSYPDIAKGTWHWDAQKREFLLEPGNFIFYIKRLPQDAVKTNRLVWGSGFLERQERK